MTAEKIVIKWLTSRANSSEPWFYSYNLEAEVPTYGRLAHQKVHTASTYARAFRKLRENNTLERYAYKLIEITENKNKKVKGWKIEKIDL
tara:strand:- start:869 stop:1138 length:270 start_codon:yes stop_codon:yes gene_type:complete